MLLLASFSLACWTPQDPTVSSDLTDLQALSWEESIDFSAHLRLRAESTFDQPSGEDRTRGRLRFRLGAQAQVSEDLRAEVRLSTASGDANNPHWDFGASNGSDTLSGSDIVLDRINLTWSPEDCALTWKAGKMGNPLAVNPVFGEWLWDGDIQPAGISVLWDGNASLGARAGYWVLDEENSAGDASDPAVTVLQLLASQAWRGIDWDFHTTLWNYSNEGPNEAQVWDVMLSGRQGSWTASAEAFQNLDDDTDEDLGWALGVQAKINDTDGVFVNYFDFEANANLWEFGQDDVPIAPGPMGLTGFIAGYQRAWNDRTNVRLWALQGDDEVDDPLRVRLDVQVSF